MTTLRRILQLSASEVAAPPENKSSSVLDGSSGKEKDKPKSPRKEGKGDTSPRPRKRNRAAVDDKEKGGPKQGRVKRQSDSEGKHLASSKRRKSVEKPADGRDKASASKGDHAKGDPDSVQGKDTAKREEGVGSNSTGMKRVPSMNSAEAGSKGSPTKNSEGARSEAALQRKVADHKARGEGPASVEVKGDVVDDAALASDTAGVIGGSTRPPARSASKKYATPKLADELGTPSDAINPPGVTTTMMIQVQCERCQKWRDIPGTVSQDELPTHWYCEMNKWDPEYSSCSVPERLGRASPETVQQQSKAKRKRGAESGDDASKRRGSAISGGKGKTPSRGAKKSTAGGGKSTSGVSGAGKQLGPRQGSLHNLLSDQKAVHADEWVQCETCKQWRRLPPNFDMSQLPEKWYCHLNTWDKSRAKCSAPQEKDTVPDDSKNGVLETGGSQHTRRRMTYRELIANHFKHFTKYESTTNQFLDARYRRSSVFVPKGVARKGAKRIVDRSASARCTDISLSVRRNKYIDASAFLGMSIFRKLFGLPPLVMGKFRTGSSKKHSSEHHHHHHHHHRHHHHHHHGSDAKRAEPQEKNAAENGDDDDDGGKVMPLVLESYESPSLLKITKPWKRAGGWVGDYYCKDAPSPSKKEN